MNYTPLIDSCQAHLFPFNDLFIDEASPQVMKQEIRRAKILKLQGIACVCCIYLRERERERERERQREREREKRKEMRKERDTL